MQYLDDAFKTWNRMIDLGLQSTEMLHTSGQTISHRTTLVGQNLASPHKVEGEVQLMSDEKMQAATLSASALVEGSYKFSQQMLETSANCFLNSIFALAYAPMYAGKQQQVDHWNELLNRQSTELSELTNTGLRTLEKTLHPIHERSTNNAKRLGKSST